MQAQTNTQKISQNLDQDLYLPIWIEAFLVDRKAQNLTAGTLDYYRLKLTNFSNYCESQQLKRIDQITPGFIRQYLLWLEETGHNAGGLHTNYVALKAFLFWYEKEMEPENWKNPIRKVKAPKVPEEPIAPVELANVERMAAACPTNRFIGKRDRALLLFLLDTGARAAECLALDIADVDQVTGSVLIKQGKGRKPRNVFLEKKARRALRAYLKARADRCPALWVTIEGDRLHYDGLRFILKRRAIDAKCPLPSPHDFRRAFALNMLRNGVDIVTLSRMMGHSSLEVIKRYLKQVDTDLKEAHQKYSPVEHSDLK